MSKVDQVKGVDWFCHIVSDSMESFVSSVASLVFARKAELEWKKRQAGRRLLAASWLFLSFHRLLLFLLFFFFLPERAREPQPAARLISPTRPHFHVVIAQSVGALSTHRSVSLSGYSAPLRVCARATFPRSDRRRSASDSRQWVVLAAAPAQLAASSSSSSSSFSPSPVWSLLDSQPTQIVVIVLVRDVLLLVFVFLVFFFYTKFSVHVPTYSTVSSWEPVFIPYVQFDLCCWRGRREVFWAE